MLSAETGLVARLDILANRHKFAQLHRQAEQVLQTAFDRASAPPRGEEGSVMQPRSGRKCIVLIRALGRAGQPIYIAGEPIMLWAIRLYRRLGHRPGAIEQLQKAPSQEIKEIAEGLLLAVLALIGREFGEMQRQRRHWSCQTQPIPTQFSAPVLDFDLFNRRRGKVSVGNLSQPHEILRRQLATPHGGLVHRPRGQTSHQREQAEALGLFRRLLSKAQIGSRVPILGGHAAISPCSLVWKWVSVKEFTVTKPARNRSTTAEKRNIRD